MQSKADTGPSSNNFVFKLPYSKDIHYFSQARHKAHYNSVPKVVYILYTIPNCKMFPCVLKSIGFLMCGCSMILYIYLLPVQ